MKKVNCVPMLTTVFLLFVYGCSSPNSNTGTANSTAKDTDINTIKTVKNAEPQSKNHIRVSTPVNVDVKQAGTRSNPVPIGVSSKIGNWSIEIVKYIKNANDIIRRENQFNDPPESGSQYVIVELAAKFVGDESGTFWQDITYEYLGSSGNTFSSASVVAPREISKSEEAFQNAIVKGNLVFMLPKDQVNGGMVIMERLFEAKKPDRTFFSVE